MSNDFDIFTIAKICLMGHRWSGSPKKDADKEFILDVLDNLLKRFDDISDILEQFIDRDEKEFDKLKELYNLIKGK